MTMHLQACSIPQSKANQFLCNQAHLFPKSLFRPLISIDPFTNLTVLKTVSLHLVESQISYLGSASSYFFGQTQVLPLITEFAPYPLLRLVSRKTMVLRIQHVPAPPWRSCYNSDCWATLPEFLNQEV